jgi:hypothetical protein
MWDIISDAAEGDEREREGALTAEGRQKADDPERPPELSVFTAGEYVVFHPRPEDAFRDESSGVPWLQADEDAVRDLQEVR